MRSSYLARVASLGISLVITLGCGKPPSAPSAAGPFSVRSISPTAGSSAAPTVARIAGTGFQSGATVTVDGSRVDAAVVSATTITLAMPAHAAGKVNVIVLNPASQAQAVPEGFYYVGPPVISELIPNIGSTAGGAPILIRGTELGYAVTLTVDGISTPFEHGFPDVDIHLSTPAHAAGTVEVILTDRFGQSGRGVFTFASPATLDFNGEWQGWARLHMEVPSDSGARLLLTIRDNVVVSVSCSVCRPGENCFIVSAPSLTPDPPPVAANGEFSFSGSGGLSMTGKILSPDWAIGSINTASCGSRHWWADKSSSVPNFLGAKQPGEKQ